MLLLYMDDDDIATYIGWKGYTIYKENISVQEQQMLRKELNVKPFVPKSSLMKPQPFPVYRESKNKIYVPRFYGMEVYGEPDDIVITDGKKINVNFKGELRPKQKPVVDKFMKHIKKKHSGLLALHTGFGKTCLALNIISRIKLKTIIIVHKEFLLRQWIERIEQFLPDAKVGKIQAKTIDTEDKDIVICMLQSLSMKDYPKDMFKEYGFMIVDEVHHLGAEVFSRAFYKVVTKYALGLSATINRKDGLTKVIKWFLGDVVCKLERKGEDNVLVKVINYETNDEDFNKVLLNFRGQVNYTGMIKKLCEFNRRTEFILKVLADLLKENPNQQIMILGHQKKLLQYLHDAIRHRTIATVGYYVGGMKEKDLKISEGKKVIIATYAMAEEGLDIKTLTTLIMATPKVDVRQSVGRILRQKHKQALVVDIVDSHSLFQRHFTKRKTFYRKSKFKVIQTNMNGYQNGDWETIYDPINKIKKAFSKTKNEDKLLQGVCLI
jgi:superfamily II DNA or RNA helicase